ncbi:MAG: MFS transporter [Micromonosporaceae bacterium]
MTRSGPLRDNVDFRRYWVGQVASDLGTQVSLVAFPLLVLALGGTPAQAGGIATGSLVARLICRLPAGVLADRCDRRRVMLWADGVRAVALGTIPLVALLGGSSYVHLLAVAVVEGAAAAAFAPAATIAVRALVPPGQLTDAMARSQARVAVVSLLGPALGGWLFTVGRLVPFAVDAGSYLASAVQIWRIRTPLRPVPRAEWTDPRLLAGVRWLLARSDLRSMFAFASVINAVLGSAVLAIVVTAERRGVPGTGIGLVVAAVGAGGVLGSVIAPTVVRRLAPARLFRAVGAVVTGMLGVLALASSPWLVGPVLAAPFLLAPSAGIVVGKAMLVGAPVELQGRVAVAGDLMLLGFAAVGPLLTGVLLGATGARVTWLVLAVLAGAITLASLPALRTPGFLGSTQRTEVDVDVRYVG